MQEINQSGRNNFSERTDELAHRLRCSLRDLAPKIGISQAMLFAYRSGKHAPTLKALKKLELAEISAGIRADAMISPPPSPQPEDLPIAASFTNLNDLLPDLSEKDSNFVFFPEPEPNVVQSAMSRIAQMSAELASLQSKLAATFASSQKSLAEFPMDELKRHMKIAGAWPHSKEDGKLTPAELWRKYAPPASPPPPDPIRAPGVRKRDIEEL